MPDEPTISATLRNLLRSEIKPDENVDWVGVPQPPPGAPRPAWLIALLGAADLAFALYFIVSAISVGGRFENAPAPAIASACLPLLVFGLVMIAAPWWIPGRMRRAASRSLYVITDRRAIVFNGGYFGTRGAGNLLLAVLLPKRVFGPEGVLIRSFTASEIRRIEPIEHDDGTTDVLFGESETVHRNGDATTVVRDGFYSLTVAAEALRLLNRLAAQAG